MGCAKRHARYEQRGGIVISMSNTFRLSRGAAICDYDVTGRQVRLRLCGPLTPSVLTAVGSDLSRIGSRLLARSFVVDLQSSVLAVPYEQLLLAPVHLEAPMRTLPIAIIPPVVSLEVFREYAWEQAKLGLLRGVFEVPALAAGWADLKAGRRYCRTPESAR